MSLPCSLFVVNDAKHIEPWDHGSQSIANYAILRQSGSVADTVADRVRLVVDASSVTQRDFSRDVGLEATKLSKSLHGLRRFTAGELAAIAVAADIPLVWLVEGTGPNPLEPTPADDASGETVKELRDEDRRTRFLEAAATLIADRGYHAVRIADIAAACGTSTGAVHYHFPGKEDVLTYALQHCVEQAFARQSSELRAQPDARRRMLTLIELQLPKPGQVRREWSVWLQFWTKTALQPELRAAHNEFYSRWSDTVCRIVRRGQSEGIFRDIDVDAFAQRFSALTDGLGVQVLTGIPGVTVDTMRRQLVDLLERDLFLDRSESLAHPLRRVAEFH